MSDWKAAAGDAEIAVTAMSLSLCVTAGGAIASANTLEQQFWGQSVALTELMPAMGQSGPMPLIAIGQPGAQVTGVPKLHGRLASAG